ncbi:MAG: dTMP kinase [Thermoplasmata archaeon]
MKGKFITVEGVDGSGKSTLTAKLGKFLENAGYDVVLTTEPTDTWLGKNVKRAFDENLLPYSEVFLFLADRCEHTRQIKKELDAGKIVLCDRYADSTYAYQGAALEGYMEAPVEWLIEISRYIVIEPDLTLLLIARPEVVIERITPRGSLTKFEKCEYLKKVHENYLMLSKKFSRIRVIDAERKPEVVFEDCRNAVVEYLRGQKNERVEDSAGLCASEYKT